MGKPKPPAPPDPARVAAAETQSHRDTAIVDAQLNRVNEVTPYGTVTYSTQPGYGGVPSYTRTIGESDSQRRLRELQEGLGVKLGETATGLADELGKYNLPEQISSVATGGGKLDLNQQLGGAYDAGAYDPTKLAPFDLSRYNTANLQTLNLDRYDPTRAMAPVDVSRFDPTRRGELDLSRFDSSRLDPLALSQYDPTRALPQYDNSRFDPTQQPGLDLSQYNQARLAPLDLGAYNPGTALGDYGGDVEAGARTLAQRGLDDFAARSREAARTRLANQGIEPGSAAYDAEMRAVEGGLGDAYARAELQARDLARADRAAMVGELGMGADLIQRQRADLLGRLSQGAGLEQAENADAFNRLMAGADLYNQGRGVRASELAQGAQYTGLERADLLNRLSQGAELANLTNQDRLARDRTGYEMYMGGRGQTLAELDRGAQVENMERADLLARMSQGAGLAGQERLDQVNALQTGFNQYNQARAAEMAELLAERQTNIAEREADYQRDWARSVAEHQLPFQDILAVISGTPLNPLNPGAVSTTRVQPTNVLGAHQLWADVASNNYNQQMGARNNLISSAANMFKFSGGLG